MPAKQIRGPGTPALCPDGVIRRATRFENSVNVRVCFNDDGRWVSVMGHLADCAEAPGKRFHPRRDLKNAKLFEIKRNHTEKTNMGLHPQP